MDGSADVVEELTCAELVERVTDYLEGALTGGELARLNAHLASCDGCDAYVEQMRATVRILQTTPGERLSERAEDELIGMLREWARGRSGR